jgi:PAS domain-containing protein
MSSSKPVVRPAAAQRLSKKTPSSRVAEERLRSVIELAADFYWEQDEHYRFTTYRPGGEPDADLEGLVGRTSWEFFAAAPESDGWDAFVATLEQRAPFRDMLHCLGSPRTGLRYFRFSGQPIFDQRNRFKGYRGIARDVTGDIRAERLARLEHAIAHALAEADDVAQGLGTVIRSMCEAQCWTAGNFWSVDPLRDTLWHEVGWNAEGEDRRSVLNPGDRLPHWLSHGPVWIGDVIRDPRTSRLERAESSAWNTGLVVPIKAGDVTIGVLDFYAARVAAPEPQFLKVLRSASNQIGSFYQRSIALEKLRESEQRFSSTMKLAAIGIAHVEEGGRFKYVNPQLCEMLGYTERVASR